MYAPDASLVEPWTTRTMAELSTNTLVALEEFCLVYRLALVLALTLICALVVWLVIEYFVYCLVLFVKGGAEACIGVLWE